MKCIHWVSAGLVVVMVGWTVYQGQAAPPDKAALERARREVRMLDDIYKTVVVLITEKYVNSEEDFAAGSAAVALFSLVKEKGWPEAKLLDVTGKPYEEKNVPKGEFEEAAAKALLAGKDYYEQLETRDGMTFLNAATPVPVVSKKCVMCHEHYADAKPGAAIGMIRYQIPVN